RIPCGDGAGGLPSNPNASMRLPTTFWKLGSAFSATSRASESPLYRMRRLPSSVTAVSAADTLVPVLMPPAFASAPTFDPRPSHAVEKSPDAFGEVRQDRAPQYESSAPRILSHESMSAGARRLRSSAENALLVKPSSIR